MNKKYTIYALVALVLLVVVYSYSRSQYSPTQINLDQVPDAQTSFTGPATTPGIVSEITPATAFIVSISDNSFTPEILDINKGNIVVWTNEDSVPHQIVGADFDGPIINKGQSYTFAFVNTGTFDYYCAIHPSMKGKIIVK